MLNIRLYKKYKQPSIIVKEFSFYLRCTILQKSITMKNTLSLFSLLLFILFSTPTLFAQKGLSNVYLIQQMDHYKNANPNIRVDQFFTALADQFHLSPDSKMQLHKHETGFNNTEHFKYQQFHQQIPVFGATYILHAKNGLVHSANGYFRPLLKLNTRANISPEEALQRAMQKHQAKTYIWERPSSAVHPPQEQPKPKLFILDPEFPRVSETAILVYQVDLYSWEPHDKQRYFVNAHTGRIEKKLPLMHDHAVPGKGLTKYYGEQDIIIDSIAPTEFHLFDPTRGDGIITQNSDRSVFVNNSNYWDLTNEAQDEVALDAHYCASRFHDLLLDKYQWNGLGNNGEELSSIVHIGAIINAFWDGESAWFGDGNCNNGPLTTLEVVGHEFTHGVIDYTSNLIYSNESGAINESLADVFGKMLEYTEDPTNFNWSIGLSFRYQPDAEPFRSMENPSSRGHPDFYKGVLWQDGGGVHTNSSVGNHWFYLISEGKTGTNEVGETYAVEGIGIEKAGAIAFLTNRTYLTEGSGYNEYYEYSILAAEELYGLGSLEVAAVKEAWKAVGVPGIIVAPDILDLTVFTSDAFRNIDTCQHDGFFTIEFMVSNVGTKTYYPELTDQVTVSYNDGNGQVSRDVLLTDSISPGEFITIVIDDFIFVEEYLNTNFTYRLPNSIDDNFINNVFYSFFTNWFYEENEVAIGATDFAYDCESNQHQFDFFISNSSCKAIPGNTPMTILIMDNVGTTYYSENFSSLFSISPGGVQRFSRSIDLVDWPGGELFLFLQLTGDPDINNNVSILDFWNPTTMEITSTNNFDSYTELDQLQVNTSLSNSLYDKDNESYFISTGRSQNPNFDSCFDPLDNLDLSVAFNSTIQSILTACVDLLTPSEPILEFDLIQYRNDALDNPFPESSMLQVSWGGNEPGEEIIFGQPEGTMVHHKIPLPTDFSGEIEFKFSTYSGTNLNNSDLLEYDVILMDNLFFSATPLSTDNLAQQSLKVFPNPVTDQLFLETTLTVNEIIITNIQGQQIYQDAAYDGSPIDLQNLANGYYFISAFSEDLGKTVVPFVKSR